MAREYSPRPLTPGTVTIWYRAPEILLGTKHYDPSIDLWSAGLVLAELLVGIPCLTGETPLDQLGLIVKLLGSPTPDDIGALSAMGCPELIRWRRESLASGRPENIERRFPDSSSATIAVLTGLLKWDPHARWTATEALGTGKSHYASLAETWWKESPRAVDKGLLPTFPEIRNAKQAKSMVNQQRSGAEDVERFQNKGSDYVFDFGDQQAPRPAKRARAK